MSLRASVLAGGLFAAGTLLALAFGIAGAPRRAMDDLRARMTNCALPGLRCAPLGVFLHQRTIGPPPDPALGLPDPSTLVSSAWIDLADGVKRLEIPATGARFFAVEVLDGLGDRVAVVSPRTVGRAGGTLVIAGPADATGAATRVEPSTDAAWIVARFAVDSEGDVAAARAVQDGLRIVREPRR